MSDLNALCADRATGAYKPQDNKWVKRKIYAVLKQGAEGCNTFLYLFFKGGGGVCQGRERESADIQSDMTEYQARCDYGVGLQKGLVDDVVDARSCLPWSPASCRSIPASKVFIALISIIKFIVIFPPKVQSCARRLSVVLLTSHRHTQ